MFFVMFCAKCALRNVRACGTINWGDDMAYKDTSKKTAYQNEYISRAYDRINLTVPKGKKVEIKAYADARGESVNSFINRLISEAMSEGQGQDKTSQALSSEHEEHG